MAFWWGRQHCPGGAVDCVECIGHGLNRCCHVDHGMPWLPPPRAACGISLWDGIFPDPRRLWWSCRMPDQWLSACHSLLLRFRCGCLSFCVGFSVLALVDFYTLSPAYGMTEELKPVGVHHARQAVAHHAIQPIVKSRVARAHALSSARVPAFARDRRLQHFGVSLQRFHAPFRQRGATQH